MLDKLGYDDVKRTKKGPDGGKDIVMYEDEDLIYVECKHWRDSAVGRPAVQKLDSAAKRAGAKRGLLVATGRFTQQAVAYAEEMKGMAVELIAREELIGLAEEAGYRLMFSDQEDDETVSQYGSAGPEEVRLALRDRMWSALGPRDGSLTVRGLMLRSYEAFYRLDCHIPGG